jgi:PTH1 family peptidyl-tRNA hydrolase
MKYLIIGLGNIGDEYENTRHNIGFKIIDKLTKDNSISLSLDRHAFMAEYKYKGKTLILIKPTTYMNLSGKAVHYWMQKEKIPVENILVLVDDIALPFGTIRMKAKGSDGGHNGLKHIQETLGHSNYARLRFGIGNNYAKGRQVEYVLGEWGKEEQNQLIQYIDKSIEGIHQFVSVGIDKAMSLVNQK